MNFPRLAAIVLAAVLAVSPVPCLGAKPPIPRKIHIAPIEMPKHPDIIGRGAIWAALLAGPVGAFAATGANNNIEAVYAEHLEKNHIDLAADLTFELIEQLSSRGFQIVGAEQADATLRVVVVNYGLMAIGSRGSVPHVSPQFVSESHLYRSRNPFRTVTPLLNGQTEDGQSAVEPVAWINTRYRMVYVNYGHGDQIYSAPPLPTMIDNILRWLLARSAAAPRGER